MAVTQTGTKGKVVQVLGAVVDIEFPPTSSQKFIMKYARVLPVPSKISPLRLSSTWVITGYAASRWVLRMVCSAVWTPTIPVDQSVYRLATRPWGASSMYSVRPSIINLKLQMLRAIQSIAKPPRWKSSHRALSHLKQASR